MNRTKEAVELMNRVADHIEDDPKSYNQTIYIREDKGFCGTTACIAGWAFALAHGLEAAHDVSESDLSFEAARLLGLVDTVTVTEPCQVTGCDCNQVKEDDILFDASWTPANGLTVPEALRKFAGGADIHDITYDPDSY